MVSAASVAAAAVATVAGVVVAVVAVVVVSRITPTTVHLLEQNFSNENLVPIVFLFFSGLQLTRTKRVMTTTFRLF